MPNHCENDLYIQGNKQPREVLKAIKSLTNRENYLFDFNRIIPRPDVTDWYVWSRKYWGTKWNAYDIVIRYRKPKSVKIKFETAWTPPLPVIVELAKKFPTYTFTLRYFERGMEFQGTLKIKGTKILKEEEKKYSGHRGG